MILTISTIAHDDKACHSNLQMMNYSIHTAKKHFTQSHFLWTDTVRIALQIALTHVSADKMRWEFDTNSRYPITMGLPEISRITSTGMMTSKNVNIFRVTGPLCGEFTGPGEFPAQRPVTRSFDVFFHLRLNKRLSKQPRGWWFETPTSWLWRQCNALFACR